MTPSRAAAAGLIVGAALAVLVAWGGRGPRPSDTSPDAAGFLAAWRQSLTGTYVLVERIERLLFNGRQWASTVTLVQRPPNRLRLSPESSDGQIGGRRVTCYSTDGRSRRCRDAGDAPPYAELVAQEVAVMQSLVSGEGRLYEVKKTRPGCYTLILRARVPAPPYGEDAAFCLDARTGARLHSVVHRSEGTEVHTARDLRAQVRDSDFSLNA